MLIVRPSNTRQKRDKYARARLQINNPQAPANQTAFSYHKYSYQVTP